MPERGSQSWEWTSDGAREKIPRKQAQKYPEFEPNSSRRHRAATGEPLAYSEASAAKRRRRWLAADDTRRVVESRAKIVKSQTKRGLKNPNRCRFRPPKRTSGILSVGKIVSFIPPAHAKAQSAWRAEVIGFVGKAYVVLDRSPVLRTRRLQRHIEVVAKTDCWC